MQREQISAQCAGIRTMMACDEPQPLAARRGEALPYAGRFWRKGLLAGACAVAAYGIALWAMTRAPVATIAALRETSVIFAALIY